MKIFKIMFILITILLVSLFVLFREPIDLLIDNFILFIDFKHIVFLFSSLSIISIIGKKWYFLIYLSLSIITTLATHLDFVNDYPLVSEVTKIMVSVSELVDIVVIFFGL